MENSSFTSDDSHGDFDGLVERFSRDGSAEIPVGKPVKLYRRPIYSPGEF